MGISKRTAPDLGPVGLIVASHESSWVSCQSITRNLLLSYRAIYPSADLKIYHLPTSECDLTNLALEIRTAKPRKLIFLDHKPHPEVILRPLKKVYGRAQLPSLYFHIYGDFTLYPLEWMKLEALLTKTPTHFICASERQAQLVSSFFKSKKSVSVCPFPVDASTFNFEFERRIETRKKLSLRTREFVFVYTGRISMQKNIRALIQSMVALWQSSQKRSCLLLAGPFDDLGAPFFGLNFQPGYYFTAIQEELGQIPKEYRDRVRFLGNLDAKSLSDLYCAGDAFVSLSLHHDEDFGMSPAEALCTGMPVLLTDWGGYASFRVAGALCRLIPTQISPVGPKLSKLSVVVGLAKLLNENTSVSRNHRLARANKLQSFFSIEAAKEILKSTHELESGTFRGFSGLLKRYGQMYSEKKMYPLFNPSGASEKKMYEEIYGNYASR